MAQLFQGKLHLINMTYLSGSQSASVIESDRQVMLDYLSHAIVPISQYAFQYGPNSLALADTNTNTLISFQTPDLSVTGGTFSDSDLQSWIDVMVQENNLSEQDCYLIPCPENAPFPLSNSHAPAASIYGYHSMTGRGTPYCFLNISGTPLQLDDTNPDHPYFAPQTSHEVAEMTVDVASDPTSANPEVCDPCGNSQPTFFDFFDENDVYLGSSQNNFSPGFAFTYYIFAIVKPAFAGETNAPAAACEYPPPPELSAGVPGWAELYTATDNLVMLDVARNGNGLLEVFGINSAGNIFHTWQTSSNTWNGSWAELYTATDNLKTLRVARNGDGRLEVFGINPAGNIYHTWQTAPNNGWAGS
jgi:hypothetical protein